MPCLGDEPDVKSEMHFTMRTGENYATVTADTGKNAVTRRGNQQWSYYHPLANVSTYQNNLAVVPAILGNLTVRASNRTWVTWGTAHDLRHSKYAHKIHLEAMRLMEQITGIEYPLGTFVQLLVPPGAEGASSSSLGFIATK